MSTEGTPAPEGKTVITWGFGQEAPPAQAEETPTAQAETSDADEAQEQDELFDAAEGDEDLEASEQDEEETKPQKKDKTASGRIRTLAKKAKDAEAKAADLEKQLNDLNAARQLAQELYGSFADPVKVMKDDHTFMTTLESLKDDPAVAGAIQKVLQQMNSGGAFGGRNPKQNEAPAADPRLEKLMLTQANDHLASIFDKGQIRAELRPILTKQVIENLDLSDVVTRDKVLESVKTAINEFGWTRDFLRGEAKKAPAARTPVATGGKSGLVTTPAAAPEKKNDSKKGEEKPRNVNDWTASQRSRFADMISKIGS